MQTSIAKVLGGLLGLVIVLLIGAALGYVAVWQLMMLSLVDFINQVKGNVEPLPIAADIGYGFMGLCLLYATFWFAVGGTVESLKTIYKALHKPTPAEQLAETIVKAMMKNGRF